MNKADLVNLVAARTELTKTDVSLVVDAAIDTIIDSVVEGKKVSILALHDRINDCVYGSIHYKRDISL